MSPKSLANFDIFSLLHRHVWCPPSWPRLRLHGLWFYRFELIAYKALTASLLTFLHLNSKLCCAFMNFFSKIYCYSLLFLILLLWAFVNKFRAFIEVGESEQHDYDPDWQNGLSIWFLKVRLSESGFLPFLFFLVLCLITNYYVLNFKEFSLN